MIRKYSLVIILLLKGFFCLGQQVPVGTELQELVSIADMYTTAPNLNFNLKVTYADSAFQTTILDSTSYTYNISNGRYFITNPEMELLQANQYSVYVDKGDSLVVISQHQESKSVFQLPLMDSVFRSIHVNSMSIQEINDTTRVFKVLFRPGSFYLSYNLTYNPLSGMVKKVKYFVANEEASYDLPTGHVLCITMDMDNYSETVQDPALFNERRYFYTLNGAYYLQAEWQEYQLQNQ